MNYEVRGANKTQRLLAVIFLALFILLPFGAHAVTLESGIPGQKAPGTSVAGPAEYIKFIYLFALGFVGIAGFVSLVVWGTVWTASGIIDKKRAAIDHIKNTLIGIALAFTAFILLNTINPDLAVIKEPGVTPVSVTQTQQQPIISACPLLNIEPPDRRFIESPCAGGAYRCALIPSSGTCGQLEGTGWFGVSRIYCTLAPPVGMEACSFTCCRRII